MAARARGYFAFPPLPSTASSSPSTSPSAPVAVLPLDSTTIHATDLCTTQPLPQGLHNHGCSSRHGNVLATHSETEWVRVGGTLRDPFGRRDTARTQCIRQEIRRLNALQRAQARWEAYEARWHAVSADADASMSADLRFCDVPWPVCELLVDRDIQGLTAHAIGEFLFESLDVRLDESIRGHSKKIARKERMERIRGALVRWHPDKVAPLLGRIVPEDAQMVREGVYRIFYALRMLQDAERKA